MNKNLIYSPFKSLFIQHQESFSQQFRILQKNISKLKLRQNKSLQKFIFEFKKLEIFLQNHLLIKYKLCQQIQNQLTNNKVNLVLIIKVQIFKRIYFIDKYTILQNIHLTFLSSLSINSQQQNIQTSINFMNRYQEMQNYLLSHPISQSSDQQKFQSQQHSLRNIENQQEHDNYLPSVKKFLSQPNPLMNKIQFTPYHPKCYYPYALNRLPKCLKDFQCIMMQKNNMNSLSEAVHGHQKLKKDVLDVLIKKNDKRSLQNKTHLVTLQQYYGHKQPIYQRYSLKQMKLQENKLKLKYFTTYVLDMAKILKKQMKFQNKQLNQNNHLSTQANNPEPALKSVISSRPNSVSRSGNFIVRQQKTPHLQKLGYYSHQQSSRKSLHSTKIEFDSNFQSGNLFRVYQKQFNQYDLLLQNDINTKGNTQWFFFSVRNVPKDTTLKFNIVNMSKSESLFNYGMKPYIFSMMRYEKRNVGWIREGQKVVYQQSEIHKKQSSNKSYYVLSFQYKFLYEGDIVYFSQSIPYTLSDLSQYLNSKFKEKSLHKLIKLKNVGITLGANEVDLLEITNTEFVNKNKKSVWIIARQHPGETTSGFMIEGIIDMLISETQESKTLLNNFIFKIVPMVNADGVVHGNSRAQFIGSDPNRKWTYPNKLHHPIIHSIKHYIERQKDNVEMFLDLHSHSRKLGTFFYGNTMSSNTAATRIYPLVVCKKDPRYTFKNCRFNGGSNNAARYALFQSLRIPLIYTVQSSFYGYQVGDHRISQYLPKDYKQMGSTLMTGFLEYQLKKNSKTMKLIKPIAPAQENFQKQIEEQLNQQEFQTQSVGSDEDPGEDQYNQKEFKKLITAKDLKKKKKTKKKLKEPVVKIKIKQPQIQSLKKPKANNSQSYYKQYFSGRVSSLRRGDLLETFNNKLLFLKKQTVSFGVQANINVNEGGYLSRRDSGIQLNSSNGFGTVLTQRNNQQLIHAKLNGVGKQPPSLVNNLCVIGQKVQQISVFGNTIGIQVTQNKQIFANRFENGNNSSANRKSFSVRQRINSFLQVKQNNFLQRGDCLTKNFFARK